MKPYIIEMQIVEDATSEVQATIRAYDEDVVRIELNSELFTKESWLEFSAQVFSVIETMNPGTE